MLLAAAGGRAQAVETAPGVAELLRINVLVKPMADEPAE